MRLRRNAAWRLLSAPRVLVVAQPAELAEPPLVKPELPKMPKQPDLRVKSEALKAEHEKKYSEELETWRERKKYYDEVEYPEYKAEYDRRAAAAKQRERAPEVRRRREQREERGLSSVSCSETSSGGRSGSGSRQRCGSGVNWRRSVRGSVLRSGDSVLLCGR